jgi:flagellar biosynthesis protein FlhB
MSSDKVYPATEKKLTDLRQKGILPYSILASRLLTLGCAIIFSNLLHKEVMQLFLNLKNCDNSESIDAIFQLSFYNIGYLLGKLSVLLLIPSLLLPFIGTKLTILPYKRYKEGTRNKKKTISIFGELFWGSVISPISLIVVTLLTVFHDKEHFHTFNENLPTIINSFGAYFTVIGLLLLIFENLRFRLSHRMSKAEIIAESLEGQMSPANRRLIDKSSSEIL